MNKVGGIVVRFLFTFAAFSMAITSAYAANPKYITFDQETDEKVAAFISEASGIANDGRTTLTQIDDTAGLWQAAFDDPRMFAAERDSIKASHGFVAQSYSSFEARLKALPEPPHGPFLESGRNLARSLESMGEKIASSSASLERLPDIVSAKNKEDFTSARGEIADPFVEYYSLFLELLAADQTRFSNQNPSFHLIEASRLVTEINLSAARMLRRPSESPDAARVAVEIRNSADKTRAALSRAEAAATSMSFDLGSRNEFAKFNAIQLEQAFKRVIEADRRYVKTLEQWSMVADSIAAGDANSDIQQQIAAIASSISAEGKERADAEDMLALKLEASSRDIRFGPEKIEW